MFCHVVLLRFDESAGDELIDEVMTQLRALPPTIPALRSYTVGRDAGLATDNADLGVIARFDDEAGYLEYRDDPGHRRVIDELILPNLAARRAVQFHEPDA